MEGERQIREMTPKAQYHYNMAQCHLIAYQLERGIIDRPLDYDDSAEAFHLVADKHLTVPRAVDYVKKRVEAQLLTTAA